MDNHIDNLRTVEGETRWDESNTTDRIWEFIHEWTILPDVLYNGLFMGLISTIEPEWTINYPFEKTPVSPMYRGEHALR